MQLTKTDAGPVRITRTADHVVVRCRVFSWYYLGCLVGFFIFAAFCVAAVREQAWDRWPIPVAAGLVAAAMLWCFIGGLVNRWEFRIGRRESIVAERGLWWFDRPRVVPTAALAEIKVSTIRTRSRWSHQLRLPGTDDDTLLVAMESDQQDRAEALTQAVRQAAREMLDSPADNPALPANNRAHAPARHG